ncbi:unnamed protein product [Somion occarium]|uniref:Co-chaperone HscB C-terminal oligomerisation domain-containing protein n=1 Tax=Somion occarium TaxID=3059160 RepID=A0ABP1CJF5_9APHY
MNSLRKPRDTNLYPQTWDTMRSITVVHPDRWAGRDEGKEQLIQSLSTTLNNANRTLADPLQRALYILKREGVITDGENIVDDPELIMDVMESREAIENAETQEEVNQIRKENQEKVEESVHEISKLVAVKDWSGVLTAATKLKYLRGIDDAAREWPRSLHDH